MRVCYCFRKIPGTEYAESTYVLCSFFHMELDKFSDQHSDSRLMKVLASVDFSCKLLPQASVILADTLHLTSFRFLLLPLIAICTSHSLTLSRTSTVRLSIRTYREDNE